MTDREYFINLIKLAQKDDEFVRCDNIADALIRNGVIFPKYGYWIGRPIAGYCDVKCSVCGHVFSNNSGRWKYCPECGSKMMWR
jgi:hypothetical protein